MNKKRMFIIIFIISLIILPIFFIERITTNIKNVKLTNVQGSEVINEDELNNLENEELIAVLNELMIARGYNEYAIRVINSFIPDYQELISNYEIYNLFYNVKSVKLNPYDPENPNLSQTNRAYNAGGYIVVNCFENELENDSNWDGLRWLLTHEIMHSLGEFPKINDTIVTSKVSVAVRNNLLEEGLADSIAHYVKGSKHNTRFGIIKQEEFIMYRIDDNNQIDLNSNINHTYTLSGNVINLFKYIGCYDELIHANINKEFDTLRTAMGEKVINGELYFDMLMELLNIIYLYMGYPSTFYSQDTVILNNQSDEDLIEIIENKNLNDFLIEYAKLSANIMNDKIDNTYDISDFKASNLILYNEEGTENYKSNSEWVENMQCENELINIKVANNPIKKVYRKRDKLNTIGLVLIGTDNEGNTFNITEGYTCTPEKLDTEGTQTITVTYKGKTTTFEVLVQEESLKSVEIKTQPNKLIYYEGEKLDTTGLVLIVTYNSGSIFEIMEGYTYTPEILNVVGKQTITVTYEGKTTTFEVSVLEEFSIDFKEYEIKEENGNIYIENIIPNTTVKQIKDNIQTNGTIEVYKDSKKIEDEDTKLATEMKIKITLNNEYMEYTAVVKGDANGDGNANINDIFKINSHRLGHTPITGTYLEASDVNGDGVADVKDIFKINSYRLRGGQI